MQGGHLESWLSSSETQLMKAFMVIILLDYRQSISAFPLKYKST